MRYWFAGIALSMAALTAWLLPPSGDVPFASVVRGDYGNRAPRSPERREALRLADELRTVERRLDHLALLDEIASVTSGDSDMISGAWLGENEYRTSDEVDALVSQEAEAFGIEVPAARIGTLFMTAGPTEQDRPRRGFGSYSTMVVTREQGEPYCFVVSVQNSSQFLRVYRASSRNNAIGPCAFYGRFGAPGAGILTWLRAGAFEMGQITRVSEIDSALRSTRLTEVQGPVARWAYRQAACAAGRLGVCEEMLLAPLDRTRFGRGVQPVGAEEGVYTSFGYLRMSTGLGNRGHALLADLRSEFGDEAFEAFWTSEFAVTEAFSSAFGISPGEWVHSWVLRHYPSVDPGPTPTGPETWLSALWLGLFFVTSVSVVRRRGRARL